MGSEMCIRDSLKIVRPGKKHHRSIGASTVKTNSSFLRKPHHEDQTCPPRPAMLLDHTKAPADETPISTLSVTSSAAVFAAVNHGVRAAMPLDLLPCGRNPIVIDTAADSPRLPHFFPLLPAAECTRLYAARHCPNYPHGRVHMACRPCDFWRKCANVFPLVSRFPSHLLSPRFAVAAVATTAAVAECTRPRRVP